VHRPRVLALLAVGLILFVSSCRADATVDLVVAPDGSGSVNVGVIADSELVSEFPDLAEQLSLDDLAASGWQLDGPRESRDGGLRVMLRHPFSSVAEANRILAQLSGPDGPFHELQLQTTQDGPVVAWGLDGRLQLEGGLAALVDSDMIEALGGDELSRRLAEDDMEPQQVFGLDFVVTLPGQLQATSGTERPGTVTFTADPSGRVPVVISARYEVVDKGAQRAGDLERVFVWAMVAYGAVVLVVVAALLVRRRLHKRWTAVAAPR
jgi:hypothetical protein